MKNKLIIKYYKKLIQKSDSNYIISNIIYFTTILYVISLVFDLSITYTMMFSDYDNFILQEGNKIFTNIILNRNSDSDIFVNYFIILSFLYSIIPLLILNIYLKPLVMILK